MGEEASMSVCDALMELPIKGIFGYSLFWALLEPADADAATTAP